jgi:DNA-binding NarL/FixJ family response regulator
VPYAGATMEAPISVLIVEDTAHVRRMLTTLLSVDGFAVVGAESDGPAAIEAASKLDPDVVVIDYKMPAMNGLETARRIKQERPDQHVILYTAFVEEPVERAAADIGVAVCVGKDEGLHSLEQEIRRLCRGLNN